MRERFLRWGRNPSLQFFVALLCSPILVIAGEAFGGRLISSFLGLTSMLFAFLLVSVLGFRSYRHYRTLFPKATLLYSRYLLGVALLSVILGVAAIITVVALVLKLLG